MDIDANSRKILKTLRTLGPLEEFFWRSGISWPLTIYLTAFVDRSGGDIDWRKGAQAIQKKFEHLRVTVRKEAGLRPFYQEVSANLPLHVFPWNGQSIPALPDYIKDNTLGYEFPLLASLLVFEGEKAACVSLVINHALIDGLGALAIMQDFLAASAGEQLTGLVQIAPSANTLFEADCGSLYVPVKPHPDLGRSLGYSHPQIAVSVLSASDASLLRAKARTNGTTVHGALVSAFFIAGRQCSKSWTERDILCLSPLDLRRLLGEGERKEGVLIGVHPNTLRVGDFSDFWALARRVRSEIAEALEPTAVRQGLMQACLIVEEDGEPDNPSTIDPFNLLRHDLMVSNYGVPALRTNFGALRLTQLFPAVCGGPDPATQTISVLTVNGEMCFTHLSPFPIKDLLPAALQLLKAYPTN